MQSMPSSELWFLQGNILLAQLSWRVYWWPVSNCFLWIYALVFLFEIYVVPFWVRSSIWMFTEPINSPWFKLLQKFLGALIVVNSSIKLTAVLWIEFCCLILDRQMWISFPDFASGLVPLYQSGKGLQKCCTYPSK